MSDQLVQMCRVINWVTNVPKTLRSAWNPINYTRTDYCETCKLLFAILSIELSGVGGAAHAHMKEDAVKMLQVLEL